MALSLPFKVRLSTAAFFYASLLQVFDGVMSFFFFFLFNGDVLGFVPTGSVSSSTFQVF